MLEFRLAAAADNLLDLERISGDLGDNFNINEPGPKSGKTAAHVAAERANFQAIYWLFDKGADFYCKDLAGKTPIDYLQQKEFTSIDSGPMVMGDRKYYLCNAHFKIWCAHDPEHFMPYLYQDDFRQYRENNPDGYASLVYSKSQLNDSASLDLIEFSKKYQISLISFEENLKELIDQYGTKEDKLCYEMASYELSQYPNQGGGNLAVVADLIRWCTVLLRKGNYTDTDVEIGQHKWTDSISVEKSLALNLGSLVHPGIAETEPWLNIDIITASSLFSQVHSQGDFRITLSKTACFVIKKVQSSLLLSCQKNMINRIKLQQSLTTIFSNFSPYLKDYFIDCGSESQITENFSSDEINGIKKNGLELFLKEEKASIIERMANLMRKRVEEEFCDPEMAHKYSEVFKNVKNDEHEKFLLKYMQSLLMGNIKMSVKKLTGIHVLAKPIWECIGKDNWEKYSIYSNEPVQSAFRSTNTVKFNTDIEENERIEKTQKCADLSFTPFGMASVLQRSQDLKARHIEIIPK